MDSKLTQLARLLKRYDSGLFPKRLNDGTLAVMKKRRDWDFYRMKDCVLWFAHDYDDIVVMCTDNWLTSGKPVDWGIEPIYWEIQKLDGWRDDTDYDKFVAKRARDKETKERSFKNEMRALAADLRPEFARATNDINTSNMNLTKRG